MDGIIKKASRKAVAALKEKIKCSDNDGHLINIRPCEIQTYKCTRKAQ